ncbi:MAG: glycosyltransferase family 4 protein [Candidatus Rokubacteria bacterium]|nr:glycosyltransferase family 4 protein [Candidatus Rokubacteria bacterium]MBI4627449.1 glycosyltransferase family 4 protein [Candidatus Rokubacteria bacterium]
MKITFLCPHLRIAGGVRAILTYADRLAARGHAVTVVVAAKSRRRALWRTLRGAGPAWMSGFGARVRWVPWFTPGAIPAGDVVVATAWQSAAAVAEAPARCGARFYLVQHYESLYLGAPEAVDATYRLPLRQIVISTWLAGIMREKFGQEAEVLVTPVDLELFTPRPLAVTSERPRVLMLHHEYAWKGVADGLEAVARARRAGRRLHLVGFGVKPPRGASPYDEFHANPPQERLGAIYASADIYLCPSWDEGLGMPPMEAMACGAALVTYDNGGCRDYAWDGETALVARRRDVADLAAKLERLAGDDALRTRIAAAGRALVRSAFDWTRAVARMEALFRSAAPGGRPA